MGRIYELVNEMLEEFEDACVQYAAAPDDYAASAKGSATLQLMYVATSLDNIAAILDAAGVEHSGYGAKMQHQRVQMLADRCIEQRRLLRDAYVRIRQLETPYGEQ